MSFLSRFFSLCTKRPSRRDIVVADKEMRENKSEAEIDKSLKDSFPASDPPGNY